MRNSVAKRLRREAQKMTTGLPYADYAVGSPPYYAMELGVMKKLAKGVPTKLKGDCTRSVLKKMKMEYIRKLGEVK